MAQKREQKEYRIWKAMKSRCYSPSSKEKNYQKNNIIVCERWKDSYDNFLLDMGRCPEKYSIERRNNLGNYEPDNCYWADNTTQAKNRGNFNILITHNNDTKVLKDWAKHFNIKYTTLYLRMFRTGLSFEDAIVYDPSIYLTYKDKKLTLREWEKESNIKYSILVDRYFRGWETNRIFEQPIKKIK